MLTPQITGEPAAPLLVTENVSVTQSPIAPPVTVFAGGAAAVVPVVGPAIVKA